MCCSSGDGGADMNWSEEEGVTTAAGLIKVAEKPCRDSLPGLLRGRAVPNSSEGSPIPLLRTRWKTQVCLSVCQKWKKYSFKCAVVPWGKAPLGRKKHDKQRSIFKHISSHWFWHVSTAQPSSLPVQLWTVRVTELINSYSHLDSDKSASVA